MKKKGPTSMNYCIVCGAVIPEGRQVCPACERHTERDYERMWVALRQAIEHEMYAGLPEKNCAFDKVILHMNRIESGDYNDFG